MTTLADLTPRRATMGARLSSLPWGLIAVLCALAGIGAAMLFSVDGATATGRASFHVLRFGFCFILMLAIALMDPRLWLAAAYPFYGLSLVLLIGVEVVGAVAMGAQRWLDVGLFRLQPSEFMKLAIILALARYYHDLPDSQVRLWRAHVPALAMLAAPAALIMLQPDLGAALIISAGGVAVAFLAGLPMSMVVTGAAAAAVAAPLAFFFVLHEFQRQRVLTFLNPDADPLGAGYHVTQAKIAIGNGGLFGAGFGQGSQAQLDFLPEAHTDFIYATVLEEFGLMGGLFVLALYATAIGYAAWIAVRCRHAFGRLLAAGIAVMFGLYVVINAGMIMGLLPVVGEPMPLLSYGGTAMLSVMIGYGLVMSMHLNRDAAIGPLVMRRGG